MDRVCALCGAHFDGRVRDVCCPTCRKKPEAADLDIVYAYANCAVCGKPFPLDGNRRKCCSAECLRKRQLQQIVQYNNTHRETYRENLRKWYQLHKHEYSRVNGKSGNSAHRTLITGYQQAILLLFGCEAGGKYLVRSVDRWYIDSVANLFSTSPYLQARCEDGKKDYWVIKSAKAHYSVPFSSIRDVAGFCRGVLELQGTLDLWRHRTRSGAYVCTPRLRLYGSENLLEFIGSALPAAPKKIQHIRTHTGSTCALYYQSAAEISDILEFVRGEPCKRELWNRWEEILQGGRG